MVNVRLVENATRNLIIPVLELDLRLILALMQTITYYLRAHEKLLSRRETILV